MNRSNSLPAFILVLICLGILLGLVWGTMQFAKKNVGGEGFTIQWISIHSLLKDGNNPYSNIVTEQIRRAVTSQNSFTLGKEPRYTSPLYSGIVVFPFALFDNRILARSLWMSMQLVAIFVIIILGLKISGWKPAWLNFFIFSLFTVLSYHVILPWIDGGLSIWAALFIMVVFWSIQNQWNEIGGIFLALSAIQPQMTVLVILFILIWALSQRRRIFVIWFFVTLTLLIILGVLLVPDWIIEYLRLLYNFRLNFPSGSLGDLFVILYPGLGKQLGLFVTFILGILLLFEGWLTLRKDFRHLVWTTSLILVISQWIGIPTIPSNMVGLIFPTILVVALLAERWATGSFWITIFLSLIIFTWEWGEYFHNITRLNPAMQLNLLLPLPFLLLIGLYWVRWWAVKPKRMLFEELRLGEH